MYRAGCVAFDFAAKDRSCRLGRHSEGMRHDGGGSSNRDACTMECDAECKQKAKLEIKKSFTPSSEIQKIVDAGVFMQKKTNKPFIIVMQASIGMVPMIKSWLCNTKTMADVHKNTLIIGKFLKN